jgi:hypothetical protein|tara:strand:+ start:8225 stop:8500 length:276 start_codon:yes stop_codon:yes gene_type:complete
VVFFELIPKRGLLAMRKAVSRISLLWENKIGYKLAHDLRKTVSNPIHNLKRRILKPKSNHQTSLFNLLEFVKLNERQHKNLLEIIADNLIF